MAQHPHLDEFLIALHRRLDRGAAEYGDGSFARPVPELVGELENEVLDLAGWAYVLFVRLRRLKEAQ
jgi:hypothetical protein